MAIFLPEREMLGIHEGNSWRDVAKSAPYDPCAIVQILGFEINVAKKKWQACYRSPLDGNATLCKVWIGVRIATAFFVFMAVDEKPGIVH